MRNAQRRTFASTISLAKQGGFGMKYIVSICALLALSGCAHDRYVVTHCLTPTQLEQLRSALPPKVGQSLTGNAQTDLKIIAGSNVELRGYAGSLLDVLAGCTGK